MNKIIKDYDKACLNIAKLFIRKYFNKKISDVEYWGIGNEVWVINDHFFNTVDMIEYIINKYTADEMFEHYEHVEDLVMKNKKPKYNIKHWLLNKHGKL